MIGGSCHIPLKDVYIAGIIGKGGVIIKDICARSGATAVVAIPVKAGLHITDGALLTSFQK